MPKMFVDQVKIVNQARDLVASTRTEMLAAFAKFQLDVQTTHQNSWDSISVRKLENQIEGFKEACANFRHAQDSVVKALAMGGDRFDSAVPSPEELLKRGSKTPDGWTTVERDGIQVLVPTEAAPASGE